MMTEFSSVNASVNVASAGGEGDAGRGRVGPKTHGGVVEISWINIWEAFCSTRPSLSSQDRARYDSAYRKFRGGSRAAEFHPVSSVDDGTLRTALK